MGPSLTDTTAWSVPGSRRLWMNRRRAAARPYSTAAVGTLALPQLSASTWAAASSVLLRPSS